jgi:DNA-binding protein H-NS
VRQQELSEAIADIRQKIQEYGITAAQLGFRGEGLKAAGRKSTPEAKYRDPASAATWAGRGAKPKWLRHYESIGCNKNEFRI